MSHTEVYDPRATERALVNEVNRAARHCRIGKVKWKHVNPFVGPFDPAKFLRKPDGLYGGYLDRFPQPRKVCTPLGELRY